MENLSSLINGKTKLIPLLAFPSEHVRTPSFFNPYCQENNINAVMVPWKVSSSNLALTMESIRGIENISGIVITIPHKTEVTKFCDRLEGAAEHLGVCNVIKKESNGNLVGRMYDGLGFVKGLTDRGHQVSGRSVLLVGAGGAATAIAYELVSQNVAELGLINRSVEKAHAVARELNKLSSRTKITVNPTSISHFDIAINGTSLGMKETDLLPLQPSDLNNHCLVAEVVMQPDITPLLQHASELGLPIHKGVHMVRTQIQLLADFTTA